MSEKTVDQSGIISELFSQLKPLVSYFGDSPLVISLVTIIATAIVASIVTIFITRIVANVAQRTKFSWDDQLVTALKKPIFWTLLLVGILIAIVPLKIPDTTYHLLQSIFITLLIISWTGLLLQSIRIILRAMSAVAAESSIVRPQTRPLFENLAFIVVLILAIYFVFRSWDVDMTAWLASAGIIGIALGFAAKDTLANLFSGVFILADAPYKISDYVVLDSGERGQVTHIGIRSTRLLTRDDVEITIPNAIMGNTRIINESGGPHEKFRIRVKVGVAYGSDIDQVKKILMDIALSEDQVCTEPEPRVRFRAFGNSSLDIELLCWIEKPEVRGRVLDDLNTIIYKRFNIEGVEIPYNKQDVYIKEMPK